jgi:hypothetical protein
MHLSSALALSSGDARRDGAYTEQAYTVCRLLHRVMWVIHILDSRRVTLALTEHTCRYSNTHFSCIFCRLLGLVCLIVLYLIISRELAPER